MKGLILLVTGILLSAQTIYGQSGNTNLLVQSPDGKTVKLIWLFKNWSSDISGFDIKRKEGLGDWVKLNKEPVLPEISLKKDLSIVESDKAEASRIKAKLFRLIADKKLKEADHDIYLQKLNTDEKAIREICDMMAHDYDVALLNGFAFVDHTVTSKTNYKYGLFIQGTDKLLGTASWNYGEIPDLNMIHEITSRATTTASGIQLTWNVDIEKMKAGDVTGFNIYREGIRLNQLPIIGANSKDLSEFTWDDRSANTSRSIQYSISAESIFGIEGTIKPYTYDPTDHPKEYKNSVVKEITALGYYFKDGMEIKWEFPTDFDRFIKGFYVEKDNIPEGYKEVSHLLDPSARSFVDKSSSPVTSYLRVRIITVYNDKTVAEGLPRLYSYFPIGEPPPPQKIKVKTAVKDKSIDLRISWDPVMSGDSLTDHYRIYDFDSAAGRYNVVAETPHGRTTSYTYNIQHASATVHRFYVTAMAGGSQESAGSDTVTVVTPSVELPAPVISNSFANADKAMIQWEYPDIRDVRGFRLYEGGNLIADEHAIKRDTREFITAELEKNNTYSFTIVAVSDNGVLSNSSAQVSVTIPKK